MWLSRHLVGSEDAPRRDVLPELLVDEEQDAHDVLVAGLGRVEVGPQVQLHVLAELQQHDALQRRRLVAAASEVLPVDVHDQRRLERRRLGAVAGRRRPVGRRQLAQRVLGDLYVRTSSVPVR